MRGSNDASDISVDTRNFVNGTKFLRVYRICRVSVNRAHRW